MKAILLARVSGQEQEDTHSIPAQVERLQSYAKKNGFTDVEIHQIVESSTKDTRKKFDKLIEAIRQSKEPTALIVETVDRLQRGFRESILLNEFLKAGKLELHFLRESLVLNKDSNSSDHLRWDMGVMFAKNYVMQLSDNVKRSVDRKIASKEWSGQAPIGYLNERDINDKSNIFPDPARAHFIVRLFELYSTGNHSMITLAKEAKDMGLRSRNDKIIGVSTIESILKNPFYYGYMKVKGQLYPHKYEPLILKELFDKCQEVREGWHKKPCKYQAIPFALRGIMKCKVCGSVITGEIKKGKYIYYHCGKRDCERHGIFVKQADIFKEVEKVFKKLNKMPQHVIDDVIEGLKTASKAMTHFHLASMQGLQDEYKRVVERKSKLYDDKLDKSITPDFYDMKFKEYTDKESDLLQQMKEHHQANTNCAMTASLLLDLAKRAWEIFKSSETLEKRALINFVLQNCVLDNKKLEYDLKDPFATIVKYSNLPVWYPGQESNLRPTT